MIHYPKVDSILYVEDEKVVQEELSEVLALYCHTLYTAENGVEGLALFREHSPDIIITDIAMPLMDGITMARHIKELNEDIHIIFTTAFSDSDFFQAAIELQAEGYILKPIDLNLLERKIKSIIKNIRLKRERVEFQAKKLKAMRDMLSAISHQWRQPLNVVSGILFNLADAYESDELSREYFEEMLKMANSNLQFLSNTIDDFKNFSRPSIIEEFSFETLELSLSSMLKSQLNAEGIELLFQADRDITIRASKNELSHVLLNLINNAKDALKSADREGAQIIIEAKQRDAEVQIAVKDNAMGIATQLQERVFEPYFSTKEEGSGTGIGLYLSKMILEKSQNNSLSLEKSDSEGSHFLIILGA